MSMIHKDVLELFSINGVEENLKGGQGTSIKVGDTVFKPIENIPAHTFIASAWNLLEPEGYKIVKHLISKKNRFVERGWSATTFEPMYEDDLALEKKIKASKSLHEDLSKLGILTLPFSDDPWTKANKTLWHNLPYEQHPDEEVHALCTMILDNLKPIDDEYQLVHADLANNTLFCEDGVPIIIDFSPAIAPVTYAHAILICDSIAWKSAPFSALKLLEPFNYYKEYIKYAIAFRILTAAYQTDSNFPDAITEWKAYKQIWDVAKE